MITVKEKLAAGRTVIAVNVGGRNPDVIAALAKFGADLAFIDCERSGIGLDSAAELLFAAKAAQLPAIVRTHTAEQAELVRFLDRGADGLVIPHVNSAHEAAAAAEVIRYACGKAAASKLLVVQIETALAIKNLDELAAVPGVDAYLIGPNDLAYDLCGERGAKNPTISAAIDDVCTRLRAQGKRFGMPGPLAELPEFRRRGATFLYYSLDWLVQSGFQALERPLAD
ncbi:aldolase/citrate lyase family protein [Bordetella sp. BOR01]|uniref:aldolase/citrate lyase family protein n=1 Tax=Bordetella sp. BOR01 TaxID=2854779 RepID=UPI001C4837D4|nr:aldolase/citrate lyase family protein [Bordetella sp. BOR01]MBV7483261.1 hypothetical protein [Bordetella sp. BOR01]